MFLNKEKEGSPVYKVLATGRFTVSSGEEFTIVIPSPVTYRESWEADTDDWNYEFRCVNGETEIYADFGGSGMAYPYLDAQAFINDPDARLKDPAGNEIDKNFVGLLNLSDNQQVKIRRYSAQIVREDASEV